MTETLVCCSDLQIGYDAPIPRLALSLVLRRGERIALLGRPGSGKSILLRTLAGALAPQGGQARVMGLELGRTPQHRIARSGVSFVGDDRGVFLTLTLADHFALATRERFDKRRALQVLSPLEDLVRRPNVRVGSLSGGERQMLGLACAVLRRPNLLIVDQLSQGMHPDARDAVVERLTKACGQDGLTVLFTDGDGAVAQRFADRTLDLDLLATSHCTGQT